MKKQIKCKKSNKKSNWKKLISLIEHDKKVQIEDFHHHPHAFQ